jgi:hypothetical protein
MCSPLRRATGANDSADGSQNSSTERVHEPARPPPIHLKGLAACDSEGACAICASVIRRRRRKKEACVADIHPKTTKTEHGHVSVHSLESSVDYHVSISLSLTAAPSTRKVNTNCTRRRTTGTRSEKGRGATLNTE